MGSEPVFERLAAGSPGLLPVGDDVATARHQIGAAALDGSDQEHTRSAVLAFTHRHADCLHRSCGPGHLTGSAVVVDAEAGTVLLIHHVKLDRWLQPGGHADGEGNLAVVALTEAGEETGLDDLVVVTPAIDVDVHRIGERPGEPAHDHLDLRFLVLAEGDHTPSPNHETRGARWVAPDDPVVTASPELARLVARAVLMAGRLG